MSGIYVHIPFCKSKCYYCDFYSVTKADSQDRFDRIVLMENSLRPGYLDPGEVDTIYFGGGTPTLLSTDSLSEILKGLRETHPVDPAAEVTLEANPDDLDPDRLEQYLRMGFNRISIGTQSFSDDHLRMMNRRHDSAQAAGAVRMASESGFSNISIDLIYGIPGMSAAQWQYNLDMAAGMPVSHLSAYHLTIEPRTRFGRMKKSGLFSEIPDEQSIEQYLMLLDISGKAGFEQYEISNFAREKRYSRHNAKYWSGESYLGLGPSAHSFNGNRRHWNPSSLAAYTRDIHAGKLPAGEEIDGSMRRNEFVMTRLRTSRGIEADEFRIRFGEDAWPELLMMAGKHVRKGDLLMEGGRLYFNREAWFHSDGILADLFVIR